MSAAELRQAANELREFWPTAPIKAPLASAVADWLDWTFDQGHSGDMDDNGCSECAPALAVARLINGGAS